MPLMQTRLFAPFHSHMHRQAFWMSPPYPRNWVRGMGQDGTLCTGAQGSVGLTVRLNDLKDFLQPKRFFNSMTYAQIISQFTSLEGKFSCLNIFPHIVHLGLCLCHWLTRFILLDLIQCTREFLYLVLFMKSTFSPWKYSLPQCASQSIYTVSLPCLLFRFWFSFQLFFCIFFVKKHFFISNLPT